MACTVEGDEADRMTVGVLALDPPLLRREMSPSDAVKLIDQHDGRAGVVIADDGIVVGLLTREDADKADGETVASAMELGPKTYRADADPADALDYMIELDIDHVIVSEPEGKLIGLLYRDIVLHEVKSET